MDSEKEADDLLGQLFTVEREAEALVAEARAEAERRLSAAVAEAEGLRERARREAHARASAALDEAARTAEAEFRDSVDSWKAFLESTPEDRAAFDAACGRGLASLL